MKKIILLLTLFFAVNKGYSQSYTQISSVELAKLINLTIISKAVEKEFKNQSSRWTLDTYVTMSRDIQKYYATPNNSKNEYGLKVTGIYEYKRATLTYTGTFEAKLSADLDDKTEIDLQILTWKAK